MTNTTSPQPVPSSPNVVWIEKFGNRIRAQVPWFGGSGPDYAKSISGARAKFEGKKFLYWTYPLDMQTCRDFRQTFGKLEIGPELWLWAMEAAQKEKGMINLRSATEATMSRVKDVAPDLDAAIQARAYQSVGAAFIANGGNVLNADQPGLGKTLQTLAGLIEINAMTTVVFSPKSTMSSVWQREILRWWPGARPFVVIGTKAQREAIIAEFSESVKHNPMAPHILICNTEMVRVKQFIYCDDHPEGCDKYCSTDKDARTKEDIPSFPILFDMEWDAVISDESHLALLGRKTQSRRGFTQMVSKHRIALSGTPYRGKIEKFWGILNWLNPDVFTSYWTWVERYFEITNDGYGQKIGKMLPHREDAFNVMVAPYVLRRTKDEVAADLPPKMYAGTPLDSSDPESTVGVWLPMDATQLKLYRQMERDALARIEGGDLSANGILAEMIRLKQFSSCTWKFPEGPDGKPVPVAPSNKLEWLLDFMAERQDSGQKVVIASQYTAVINLFREELDKAGYPSYVLTGETKQRDRTASVAAFQDPADTTQVFFLNTFAGGVGITLDAADELVLLDETYIPDDQEQVEDRIHRVSRIHNVTIYYLRSLGTIEETICSVTGAREAVIKGQLDGSRGINVARKLLNNHKK